MNQTYTYEEVITASTEYFGGDEFAASVFASKYAMQNKEGQFLELTPKDMHKRLSLAFTRIENKYPNPMSEEEIFELFDQFKYVIPQGSPMSGINNPYHMQSLGNCFVIDSPSDSYGGICKADQELAQLMKRRAGVGLDISHIRPKGSITNNSAKTSDGIAVFMERFSNTTREVAQGGRRGALMQSISIKHPEIETFIDIKKDLKKVTGANISIRITDDFMNAVKNNENFILQWPVDSKNPSITKIVKAKDIWDKIINSAWISAEPGVLFWDTIINNSVPDLYIKEYSEFKTQSTNPCGEVPLGTDSCRLMVLNLYSFVENKFTKKSKFNFKLFEKLTIKAQRLMDDLIDLELEIMDKIILKIQNDPESEEIKLIELNMWKKFKSSCEKGRRTGLGITALGDTLAALNIKYGSRESIEVTEKIYKTLGQSAHKSSCIMAKERGAFPIFSYELEKDNKYLNRLIIDKNIWKTAGRRNIALTTTAPVGSLSTLTQTTSGIEPVFMLSYIRRKKINPSDKNAKVDFIDPMGDKWSEFTIYHHGVKQWMDMTGETDIKKSPYYQATANEIDWLTSVEMQSVAQKYISHSISKTCNLPNSATKELVSEAYMKAWESGCKGFTVYRDGCRTGVLISEEDSKKNKNIDPTIAQKRPIILDCDIKKAKVNGEGWTIFVGLLDGKVYEVFGGLSKYIDIPNKHKTGKIIKNGKNADGLTTYNVACGEGEDEMIIKDIANIFENKTNEAFTRMISLNLRHGTPINFIAEQLLKDKHAELASFSKVMARVLKLYIKDGVKVSSEKNCPQCNKSDLKYQEGCLSCTCGYSKC